MLVLLKLLGEVRGAQRSEVKDDPPTASQLQQITVRSGNINVAKN